MIPTEAPKTTSGRGLTSRPGSHYADRLQPRTERGHADWEEARLGCGQATAKQEEHQGGEGSRWQRPRSGSTQGDAAQEAGSAEADPQARGTETDSQGNEVATLRRLQAEAVLPDGIVERFNPLVAEFEAMVGESAY